MNYKNPLTIALIVVIVILLGIVIYLAAVKPASPVAQQLAQPAPVTNNPPLNGPTSTPTAPGGEGSSERERMVELFRPLAAWKTTDAGGDVQIRECANGKQHDPRRAVLSMHFEASRDADGAYQTSGVTTRIPAIQQVLQIHGWEKCSADEEAGFYYQTTYIRNGRLLGLNWGTRDAVVGGTYITIQFEYEK